MVEFTVVFTTEADTLADAEADVQTWTVTPGTTLQQISGAVMSDAPPIEVLAGGLVADGQSPSREAQLADVDIPPAPPMPDLDAGELGKLNPDDG
jgi:hypothetical protein